MCKLFATRIANDICRRAVALYGEAVQHTGLKRSEAEQNASSKADWLGSGIKGA